MSFARPIAAFLLVSTGCITPAAVMEGGRGAVPIEDFPPGTEPVEVAVRKNTFLRGVFVPSDPGAPLVVHFLESGCSVSQGSRAFPSVELVWQLRDLGLASLVLDYRGVGPSDGKRSPENLRGDALAAWREALRRAGGDPRRVVVRGMSIGALAAAALLEEGAEPAAAILVAPVRGETVSKRYVERAIESPFGFLLSPFLKEASDVELLKSLERSRTPLFVAAPGDEYLLSQDERRLVRYSVRAAGGRWTVFEEWNHMDLVLEAHRLLPGEADFLREVFPDVPSISARVSDALDGLPPEARSRLQGDRERLCRLERIVARRRLDPPALASAFALHGPEPGSVDEALLFDWLRRSSPGWVESLPWDALVSLVDLADPSGALDPSELSAMSRLASLARRASASAPWPERLVGEAVRRRLHRRALYDRTAPERRLYVELFERERSADLDDPPLREAAPARLRLAPQDSLRQAVRLLLRAGEVPERALDARTLEVWEEGRWRKLELPRIEADG